MKRDKKHPIPFDVADWLDNEDTIQAYLQEIIDGGDAGELAEALGDISRARGMTQVASTAGLTREALYKALRSGTRPRFDTVRRVCLALGFELKVTATTVPKPDLAE